MCEHCKFVLGLSNFLTLQTFRATQNHLFRTNRTLYMQPASFSGLPRRKRSRVYAPNAATKYVAQGAALFAGPEALLRSGTRSCRRTAIREWITCSSGRAGHDFGPARPEAFVLRGRTLCCRTKSLRIRTYTKRGEGVPA